MGIFRYSRPSNNIPTHSKYTIQGNRLYTNVQHSGMAAYSKRRIYFMDGSLVLTIILTIFIDIRFCSVDALAPITSLPHSVTNTISDNQSIRTTRFTTVSTTPIPTQFAKHASKSRHALGKGAIQETLVIPSSNSEREAQEIYDKALKQFDSYGASARKECATWEQRGCQCSGTVDELILSCRAIAFNATPTDLPKNLIKL